MGNGTLAEAKSQWAKIGYNGSFMSQTLVFVLGLYKVISNSLEQSLNILYHSQIVVILFTLNLFN